MFTPRSRYASVPDGVYTDPGGRKIPFKRLRPIPTDLAVRSVYAVAPQDRFDLVAYAQYGDPEQFWRICDANRGMWPDDLLAVPGRQLAIPPPG
jgi:hypothetical protein